MPWTITEIVISYLIGSIPTAYLFVRILKGRDIRKLGSGNVGATNASRVLGKKLGILILALDIFKGALPVIFLAGNDTPLRIIIGIACICGHNWPVFLRFKGGKGVATTVGVLLGLAVKSPALWIVFGMVMLSWIAVFALTRIVSIASILAALSLPVFVMLFKQPNTLLLFSIIISFLIIMRHSPNIKRLLKGQEPRFNLKKSSK